MEVDVKSLSAKVTVKMFKGSRYEIVRSRGWPLERDAILESRQAPPTKASEVQGALKWLESHIIVLCYLPMGPKAEMPELPNRYPKSMLKDCCIRR